MELGFCFLGEAKLSSLLDAYGCECSLWERGASLPTGGDSHVLGGWGFRLGETYSLLAVMPLCVTGSELDGNITGRQGWAPEEPLQKPRDLTALDDTDTKICCGPDLRTKAPISTPTT